MTLNIEIGDYIHVQDIFGKTLRSGILKAESIGSVLPYTQFEQGVAYHFTDSNGIEYVEWTHRIEIPKKGKTLIVRQPKNCVYAHRDFSFHLDPKLQNISNEQLSAETIKMFLSEYSQYDIPNLSYSAFVIRSGLMCIAQIEVLAKDNFNFDDPFGVNSRT